MAGTVHNNNNSNKQPKNNLINKVAAFHLQYLVHMNAIMFLIRLFMIELAKKSIYKQVHCIRIWFSVLLGTILFGRSDQQPYQFA